jgi:hypothetical protein
MLPTPDAAGADQANGRRCNQPNQDNGFKQNGGFGRLAGGVGLQRNGPDPFGGLAGQGFACGGGGAGGAGFQANGRDGLNMGMLPLLAEMMNLDMMAQAMGVEISGLDRPLRHLMRDFLGGHHHHHHHHHHEGFAAGMNDHGGNGGWAGDAGRHARWEGGHRRAHNNSTSANGRYQSIGQLAGSRPFINKGTINITININATANGTNAKASVALNGLGGLLGQGAGNQPFFNKGTMNVSTTVNADATGKHVRAVAKVGGPDQAGGKPNCVALADQGHQAKGHGHVGLPHSGATVPDRVMRGTATAGAAKPVQAAKGAGRTPTVAVTAPARVGPSLSRAVNAAAVPNVGVARAAHVGQTGLVSQIPSSARSVGHLGSTARRR